MFVCVCVCASAKIHMNVCLRQKCQIFFFLHECVLVSKQINLIQFNITVDTRCVRGGGGVLELFKQPLWAWFLFLNFFLLACLSEVGHVWGYPYPVVRKIDTPCFLEDRRGGGNVSPDFFFFYIEISGSITSKNRDQWF